jgi:hypothetical protein
MYESLKNRIAALEEEEVTVEEEERRLGASPSNQMCDYARLTCEYKRVGS